MDHSLRHQFLNPPEEFTPIPFWFWNGDLRAKEIRRQIHDFYEKGVTGFVLHPRMGIPKDIVYLSAHFMDLVHTAVLEADELGMSVILYDEAMYPSGSAKGMVVKDNPEFASKGLKMTEYPCDRESEIAVCLKQDEILVSAQAVKKNASMSIDLDAVTLLDVKDGKVTFQPPDHGNWSVLLFTETFSRGTIRGIHVGEDDAEENAPASTDLLHPEAIKKFVHLTHDTYYHKLKGYFDNTIIGMFTDEPNILGRNPVPGLKPWTTDLLAFYKEMGNQETHLPVLWFDAGNQTSAIRTNYDKMINRRLTEAYYKPISDWCADHGIALTGHPSASDDIGLLEHFHIPGQDVVWRWVAPENGKALEGEDSTAGKCSADSARHRGRRRNLNEFLGVCSKESDWALSPGDMKWYMDWLLVRGVNMLSPHAFYYSIEGKHRSHERPPDVGPNNHWWPHYKLFAQYMKRVSWLMTDSTNITSVAVLCEEAHLPWKITKPLFENQVEFNYLEESLFLSSCILDGDTAKIAKQTYQVIIIEDSTRLEEAVIEKLERFISHGGQVIICQDDAQPLIPGANSIISEEEIIEALPSRPLREVKLFPGDTSIRVSKVVKEDYLFYFFVNEGEQNYEGTFRFEEKGKVEKWDPWVGSHEKVILQQDGNEWIAPLHLPRRESIIYFVDLTMDPVVRENPLPNTHIKKKCLEQTWTIETPYTTMKSNSLSSWHKWGKMEYFSGAVMYRSNFEIETNNFTRMYLDLGQVQETAHVSINGQPVGVKMWAPYRLEIDKSYIKVGINTIEVEVTNSMANKMDLVHLDSGLMGPVSLELMQEV